MSTRDKALPDGYRVRVYSHGGIDVCDDNGDWVTVASTSESCAALAKIAMAAAESAEDDDHDEDAWAKDPDEGDR